MNRAAREKIQKELDLNNILDVYWHKGRLFVINDYDFEDVQNILQKMGFDSVLAVLADEMADLLAY